MILDDASILDDLDVDEKDEELVTGPILMVERSTVSLTGAGPPDASLYVEVDAELLLEVESCSTGGSL